MKKLYAFVAMPFGKKTGSKGTVIDFNPTTLKQALTALAISTKAIPASWHDRKISPAFNAYSP